VILNEYSAVGGSARLGGGTGRDSVFGSIDGNGGNWFELLVVDDHVDMRQWKLDWTEIGGTENAAGTISLKSHSVWSDLRSGTIITFIETANADGAGISTKTDSTYDPLSNDWWINVATQEEQTKPGGLATTTTNRGPPGDFSVSNDNWMLTIRDAAGTVVFGPVGEGATSWTGGNVGSEEAGKLEGPTTGAKVNDWQSIVPGSGFYKDAENTSFGAPNLDQVNNEFVPLQDVSALRAQVTPVPTNGDFNGDGQLTAQDINMLTQAVRSGSTDQKFDVNADQQVNSDDRTRWVEGIKKTYFGDSDLDGEFSSTDFVAVFQAGQYEDSTPQNSLWETGDWDGDGEFSTTDFVLAFQAGGYEKGPRPAVSVPEPMTLPVMLGAVGLGLATRWRRRMTG
jgi:hypothetical protein